MKNKSCDNQGAPRMRGARQRGVPLMPMLNPEDVLPADHLIRGIWLSVRGLDWTAYENGIRGAGRPRVVVRWTRGCWGRCGSGRFGREFLRGSWRSGARRIWLACGCWPGRRRIITRCRIF